MATHFDKYCVKAPDSGDWLGLKIPRNIENEASIIIVSLSLCSEKIMKNRLLLLYMDTSKISSFSAAFISGANTSKMDMKIKISSKNYYFTKTTKIKYIP